MTELKGFDKIDELVNAFVNRFDCDAEFGEEFCYWHDDATIFYNLIIGTLSDMTWTEYVKEVFNYTIENIFVFSLLHEIGHHFTMDNFTRKDYNAEHKKIAKIEASLKDSEDDDFDKILYKEYFDLPMEKAATAWAVKYARKNKTQLFYFWKKLEKALKEFYRLNLDAEDLA